MSVKSLWGMVCVGFLFGSIVVNEHAPALWRVRDEPNPDLPGRRVAVFCNEQLIAALIYGDGQSKVYLHVYGEDGKPLTNAGLTADGKPVGLYPHHRGIFIGWNRIRSDLGTDDLWHMRNTVMKLAKLDEVKALENGALIVATITWHSANKDTQGSDLLLTEKRRLLITRPKEKSIQVDAEFTLTAARDLVLDGDCHHAGIHFRAANEVAEREKETRYEWEPPLSGEGGRVASRELKWARLVFPIGNRWYACTIFNAPTNPTEELSWRAYGRFGFFFRAQLQKGQSLTVAYRFLIEPVNAPERTPAAQRSGDSKR